MKRSLKWIITMMLLFILMASCSKKTNYAVDEPFIVVTTSPAGPDDYRNLFSRNYAIYDNGTLILYTEPTDELKIADDAPVYETQVKKREVKKIKELINEKKFWKLKEDLSTESEDGSFLYITVNLTDESKTVGGLNPDNPNFMEIRDEVSHLLSDETYENWMEEIENYIVKMNP